MKVYLKGRGINLKPTQSVGKGGEVEVFDIGKGLVAKVFKNKNHKDFLGLP